MDLTPSFYPPTRTLYEVGEGLGPNVGLDLLLSFLKKSLGSAMGEEKGGASEMTKVAKVKNQSWWTVDCRERVLQYVEIKRRSMKRQQEGQGYSMKGICNVRSLSIL